MSRLKVTSDNGKHKVQMTHSFKISKVATSVKVIVLEPFVILELKSLYLIVMLLAAIFL